MCCVLNLSLDDESLRALVKNWSETTQNVGGTLRHQPISVTSVSGTTVCQLKSAKAGVMILCLLYPLSFWVVRCDRAPSDGGLNEPLEPDFLWRTDMLLLVDERIWALLKRHLQQTLTYWSAFFSFGLCISFLGPTILDLRCQTQSTLEQITWVFFSQQFFLLVGSCLGGLLKKTWVIGWFGYQEAPRKKESIIPIKANCVCDTQND